MQQQVSIPAAFEPNARMVTVGLEHTCAFSHHTTRKHVGMVMCWGSNAHGQSELPKEVTAAEWFKDNHVTALDSGDNHVCMLWRKRYTQRHSVLIKFSKLD